MTFNDLNLNDFQQKYENIMLDKNKRLKYCPKKTSIHLTQENDMDVTYMNTMPAKTDKGSFVKSIYVDLRSSKKTIEDILYIDKNGNAIRMTNSGLTPYRCGMMACLILRYFLNEQKEIKVGFIGTGNINKTIASTIHKWIPQITSFGIKNRSNSKDDFKYFNYIITTDYNIANCNVVFSCTSNTSKNFIKEVELSNVQCLVSLDGGNIYDSSTRLNRDFYSDHVEQIQDVYCDEFPYDTMKPLNIKQLDNSLKYSKKSFVNLYGIAYADAILFEQLMRI